MVVWASLCPWECPFRSNPDVAHVTSGSTEDWSGKEEEASWGVGEEEGGVQLQGCVLAQAAHWLGHGHADSTRPSYGLHHGPFLFSKQSSLGGSHFGVSACSRWGRSPCHRRHSWCGAFPSSLIRKLMPMYVPGSPPWWPNTGRRWKKKQTHVCWTLWELPCYGNWATQGWKVQPTPVSGIIPCSPSLILEINFSLSPLSLLSVAPGKYTKTLWMSS